MTKFRNLGILFMLFSFLGLTSCDDDDNADGLTAIEEGTVNDIVNANRFSTSLKAALSVSSGDLPTTLNGSGPITLFAPSNVAFSDLADQLGFASATELLGAIDPGQLQTILTYHIVTDEVGTDNLSDGTSVTTVQGGNLTVSVSEDGAIRLSDATELPETDTSANVTDSNPDATNGIVHFIDKVLLPQEVITALSIDIRPTTLELVSNAENLSTLVSALNKAGLAETIAGLDSTIVLAPSNQAFEELLGELGDDYNSLDDFDNEVETTLLRNILTYHVLTSSSELAAGEAVTAYAANSVEVIAANGGFVFGDATEINANITTANLEGKNGTVQVIDKVLLPETAIAFIDLLNSDDLATTVVSTPELSILEEALVATDLVSVFTDTTNDSFVQGEEEKDEDFEARRTPENYTYFNTATVFGPSNVAFEDFFAALGDDYTSIASFNTEDELELLTEVLLYHVISGSITSTDLTPGPVTTAAGLELDIVANVGASGFVIGDASNNPNANIVLADVAARNGVAHVVDKVLLTQRAIDLINSFNVEDEDDVEDVDN